MSCVMEITSTVIEPPGAMPIDLLFARQHLRSLGHEEDMLIESWVQAAGAYFTMYTGRPILHTVFEAWLDAFPLERRVELPYPPLVEVLSVQYVASDGSVADFSGGSPTLPYWQSGAPAGLHARRGWIEPRPGMSWPQARSESGAVRIRYRAGYAAQPSGVPDLIRQALLPLVGSSDRFRTSMYISEGARLESLPFGPDQLMLNLKYTALPSQVLHRP